MKDRKHVFVDKQNGMISKGLLSHLQQNIQYISH